MDREPKEMISVSEAEALLQEAVGGYKAVTLSLGKCQGRVLREPIKADRAQPPFNRVAMDGIAISLAAYEKGLRRFAVEGMQKAGEAPKRLASEEGCLEVMTGAVLPEGTDAVISVEEIAVADGYASLLVGKDAKPDRTSLTRYRNVHRSGSDCAEGETIVPEGTALTAPHIGAAAAFGMDSLKIAYAPSVAIIATGDELVDPDRKPLGHQIRRSNPYAIEAALRQNHIDRVALLHSRDEPSRLRRCLEGVLGGKCDVVIMTGGVSMGRTDYVPSVLKELGIKPWFHKVKQKPGKPFWFGLGASGIPVFALPGNPASVLVCLYRYVLPALLRAMGSSAASAIPVTLEQTMGRTPDSAAPKRGSLTVFRPVTLRRDGEGKLLAAFVENQGSGDFSGWAKSDGFVELAPGGEASPSSGAPAGAGSQGLREKSAERPIVPLYRW